MGVQLILYPSSEKAGGQWEHTWVQVYHSINLAFSFLPVFSLNLYLFSIILKRNSVSVFWFSKKSQSILLKESELFQITRQEMAAMSDSWFSGVICGMAGSAQEAAIPNEEALLL